MAGGIGSRFWPLSRTTQPKTFIDILGTGETLIHQTFRRFESVCLSENIFIVTNEMYRDIIKIQIPHIHDEQIICEPTRRNTAPCIAYAVNRIKSMTNKANIIVAPSDHLILKETDFLDTMRIGLNFVENNNSLLTLGIKPSRPETGYGYIQIDEGETNLRKVKTFTEKPNAELAKVFYETGEFFWNSGIFLWNLQTIVKAFDELLPEVANKFTAGKAFYNTPKEQEFIDQMYQSCPNISIDYGIMEKATDVHVLCSDFGWTDLGTWGSLYEMSPKDEQANVTLKCKTAFYESTENIVALPAEKLVVIQDLNGYIVAESDHVLLICKRENEQRIRQYVNDINVKFDGKYI